ncbi:hypothetical protein C5B42_02480 [Candidatus Cerribacteria bacterium 'Amazon FNV 2010 28 9']|uniref:Uncharacterized protein n=1 Tax=Candidatus Cerribacteria bacterium 'Amazon FNV 2010 28 9' TaxID=2081795 RepID=A0A317JU41_9BACT|nr:MAG: hypothetical protein C5B42_02480 [Candidatus Cerribacteria bacterium 'Amazon FNV 2010 28 9']
MANQYVTNEVRAKLESVGLIPEDREPSEPLQGMQLLITGETKLEKNRFSIFHMPKDREGQEYKIILQGREGQAIVDKTSSLEEAIAILCSEYSKRKRG